MVIEWLQRLARPGGRVQNEFCTAITITNRYIHAGSIPRFPQRGNARAACRFRDLPSDAFPAGLYSGAWRGRCRALAHTTAGSFLYDRWRPGDRAGHGHPVGHAGVVAATAVVGDA